MNNKKANLPLTRTGIYMKNIVITLILSTSFLGAVDLPLQMKQEVFKYVQSTLPCIENPGTFKLINEGTQLNRRLTYDNPDVYTAQLDNHGNSVTATGRILTLHHHQPLPDEVLTLPDRGPVDALTINNNIVRVKQGTPYQEYLITPHDLQNEIKHFNRNGYKKIANANDIRAFFIILKATEAQKGPICANTTRIAFNKILEQYPLLRSKLESKYIKNTFDA